MNTFTAGEKLAFLKLLFAFKEAGIIEDLDDFESRIEEAQKIVDEHGESYRPPQVSN